MPVIKAADVRIEKAAPEGTATNEKQKSQDHDITPAAIAQALAALVAAQEAVERLLDVPPLYIRIEPLLEEGPSFWVLVHPWDLHRLPGELRIERDNSPGLRYNIWKDVSGIRFVSSVATLQEAKSCA